jgi:hypothetical protein
MKTRSLILSILGVVIASFFSSTNLSAQTVYSYTGGPQYFTVPAGTTVLNVCVTGAAGANGADGGLGVMVTAPVSVTAGDVLEINVGGMGVDTIGGWNGGGAGGSSIYPWMSAGGGGGASDIRIIPYTINDRVVVAGGGGGMGGGEDQMDGGNALCPDGENGEDGFGGGGGGATTTVPGAGGVGWAGANSGDDGILGNGGAGAMDTCYSFAPGGGGGGGWYGGGGGAADCFNDSSAALAGAGGGGSSFIPVGGWCTEFVGVGNGEITIGCTGGGSSVDNQMRMSAFAFIKQEVAWIISEGQFQYEIWNINGRLIRRDEGFDKVETSMLHYSKGLYIVKVRSERGEWTAKMVY